MKRAAICATVLFSCAAIAEPTTRYGKIMVMPLSVDVAVGFVGMSKMAENYEGAEETRDNAVKELSVNLDQAIEASKGSPPVLEAVKDYYLAASTCLDQVLGPEIASRDSCATMDTKKRALELELKLAGITNTK